jgi:hypothetical protein
VTYATRTIKEILNERGISPLFSNVYVSLDLSPLHLKWGIDASKFEDGDDHEDDEEHRDAVNVEISSPQPTGAGKPNAPKAGVSSEEAVIELKSEDEVLVFLPDCLTDDVRENGPCLYGRGALYSKLGIEPDDWRAAGIVRLRSDTLQRTISDEDMNEDDMAVLVQTRDVERMMPGHSNLLCVEASKRTSDPQVHKIPYHAQYSRLPDEVKEYLELKKAQTGFLHMGVCGSDLTFYVNTLYDYVPDDPASFVQVCIWPILSELDHGPEFRLLPRMARVTEGYVRNCSNTHPRFARSNCPCAQNVRI